MQVSDLVVQNQAKFHSPHVRVSSALLERLHIVLGQFLRVDLGIEVVSSSGFPIFEVIGHEMLAGGNHLLDRRVVTSLKSIDERSDIRLEMHRIFARCFLSSAPSWISAASLSVLSPERTKALKLPFLTCKG